MAILQEGRISRYQRKNRKHCDLSVENKVCARSKPKKGRKKTVRLLQQAQSNKMKVLSPFLNPISEFLQIGFKQIVADQDISANNAAKSFNLKNAIKGEFPLQEINWDKILVADGELVKPENVVVTLSEDTFNFVWDEDQTGIGSPNDRAIILLYDKTFGNVHANYSGARRDELKDNFRLNPLYSKERTYEVFIAFKDVMSDHISKSVYCGRFIN